MTTTPKWIEEAANVIAERLTFNYAFHDPKNSVPLIKQCIQTAYNNRPKGEVDSISIKEEKTPRCALL